MNPKHNQQKSAAALMTPSIIAVALVQSNALIPLHCLYKGMSPTHVFK